MISLFFIYRVLLRLIDMHLFHFILRPSSILQPGVD